jgi:hypothetical protein
MSVKADYSEVQNLKTWPAETLQIGDKLVSSFFEGKKVIRYSILRFEWQNILYNYSLLIWNGSEFAWTRFGSVESMDGEYLPFFSKIPMSERNGGLHRQKYINKIKDFVRKKGIKVDARHYPNTMEPEEYPSEYKWHPLIDTLICYASMKAEFGEISFRPTDSILGDFPEYKPLNPSPSAFPKLWENIMKWGSVSSPAYKVNPTRIAMGIKLIPLKNIAIQTSNPMFRPATEIWINRLTNLFLTYNVSPAFAFYYGNKVMDNTDAHVYQNMSMHQIHESDRIMREREHELSMLYAMRDPSGLEKHVTEYSKLVQLSGMSLALVMGYGGLSPIHFGAKLANYPKFDTTMLMFEYMQGFYALSLHGIIHNDPHMNNVLIDNPPIPNKKVHLIDFRIPHKKSDDQHLEDAIQYGTKYSKENKKLVYGMDEKGLPTSRPYEIPEGLIDSEDLPEEHKRFFIYTLRYRAKIIDFSRAVIFNPQAEGWQMYQQEGFYQRARMVVDNLMYYVNSDSSLPSITQTMLGGYTYDELVDLTFEESDLMYKCLQVLDVILFCRNWYDSDLKNNTASKLVKNIYTDCCHILHYRLYLMKTNRAKLADLSNPLPAIIVKHFPSLMEDKFFENESPILKYMEEKGFVHDPSPVLNIYTVRSLKIQHDAKLFGDYPDE